jgi:hypothetical protein
MTTGATAAAEGAETCQTGDGDTDAGQTARETSAAYPEAVHMEQHIQVKAKRDSKGRYLPKPGKVPDKPRKADGPALGASEAIQTCREIMRDADAPRSERLKAAEVLSRILSRTPEPVAEAPKSRSPASLDGVVGSLRQGRWSDADDTGPLKGFGDAGAAGDE